jgi:tetratricopeptide (TPR) repeat protein
MRTVLLVLSLAFLFAVPAKAQQKDQAPPTPPPATGGSSGESSSTPNGPPPRPADSSPGEPSSRSTPKPPPSDDVTTYVTVTAEEDVEVGQFYVRKGDIDAAIGRFQDAIRLRSNFAKPRLLAAEAFEKKGDKTNAVKYYKEYLQVLPKAPDAKKIQGRIERLSAE